MTIRSFDAFREIYPNFDPKYTICCKIWNAWIKSGQTGDDPVIQLMNYMNFLGLTYRIDWQWDFYQGSDSINDIVILLKNRGIEYETELRLRFG